MKKVLVPLVLLCLVVSATPLAAEDAAPKHGLMTVDSAWVKAMLANDPAACAALYADDAVLVLPGTGAISGRKAIEEAYTGWLAQMRVTDAAVSDARYESSGHVSSGWGQWKVTSVPKAGGSPVIETETWCALSTSRSAEGLNRTGLLT